MNIQPRAILWYACAAAAGIQLFYYLFFFARVAFYNRSAAPVPPGTLPLSVVICAKDEEHNLGRNLPVILQQRYHAPHHEPCYEVIVVNDNSIDDSVHYL